MSENTPVPPAPEESATIAPSPSNAAPSPGINLGPGVDFNIGEEFGTASKKLPPAKIVLACVAALAVIFAVASFLLRTKPAGAGSIDNVAFVEVPGQNMLMVSINVSFQNNGKKSLQIHNIAAELETSAGSFKDNAASAVDFDRYFQAFPALKEHALPPLKPEDKIAPGDKAAGTIIVTFPVTPDAFNSRKSLKIMVWPYDQPVPLVLTK